MAAAAPSAFVVATRAADGGSNLGHDAAPQRPTGPEGGQVGEGGGGDASIRPSFRLKSLPPLPGGWHTALYHGYGEEVPASERPTPLLEVWPQVRHERHCGSGFELVLDATVPQMGRKMVEVPLNCLMVSDWMVEEAAFQETPEVKLHET